MSAVSSNINWNSILKWSFNGTVTGHVIAHSVPVELCLIAGRLKKTAVRTCYVTVRTALKRWLSRNTFCSSAALKSFRLYETRTGRAGFMSGTRRGFHKHIATEDVRSRDLHCERRWLENVSLVVLHWVQYWMFLKLSWQCLEGKLRYQKAIQSNSVITSWRGMNILCRYKRVFL